MILESCLTKHDKKVIEHAACGTPYEVPKVDGGAVVHAEVVQALCLRLRADWYVHPRGIRISGPKPRNERDSGGKLLINGDLNLSDSTVGVPLVLQNCRFDKTIRLLYTKARWINLRGSLLRGGLNGEGLEIDGQLDLSSISSRRRINLVNALIRDDLDLTDAYLSATFPYALTVGGATVGGNVLLKNVEALGAVRLPSAKIAGDLDCDGALFMGHPIADPPSRENPKRDPRAEPALVLRQAKVDGEFRWSTEWHAHGDVDLSGATVERLADQKGSWPDPEHEFTLQSDDFEFRSLRRSPSEDWLEREIWFSLQRPRKLRQGPRPSLRCFRRESREDPDGFTLSTQPYDQVAAVYLAEGDKQHAKRAAVLKNTDLRLYGHLNCRQSLTNFALWLLTLYGFTVWRLIPFGVGVVSIFAILLAFAFNSPSELETTPNPDFRVVGKADPKDFSPVFYSIDVFIPLIDLGQQGSYKPVAAWASVSVWLFASLGWFTTALLAGAVSGLIRRL